MLRVYFISNFECKNAPDIIDLGGTVEARASQGLYMRLCGYVAFYMLHVPIHLTGVG
jgi:hypothetical protein